jgi:ankyrin repeat protein
MTFWEAFENRQIAFIRRCLKYGVNINHKNKLGSTVLIEAAKNMDLKLISIFLENGAALDIQDEVPTIHVKL